MAQHQKHQCKHCGKRGQLVRPKPCDCGGTIERCSRRDRRVFPVEPLIWAAGRLGITEDALRRRLLANTPTWVTAKVHGLTVWQADRWAIAVDMHPVILWGDAWIDEALNGRDRAEVAFHVVVHDLIEAEGLVA